MKKLIRVVLPMQFKADAAPEARTFEGLTAVWDQDLGGDVIHKGAFKETIKAWKGGGDALPLLNSHDQFNIFSSLGQLVDAKETSDGLWSKWEVVDGEDGDKVMRRLRPSTITDRPIVGKMSIGFIPTEFDFEQPKGTTSFFDRVRHIRKIDWKESSLVMFPMAPGASIDAATVKMLLKDFRDVDAKDMSPDMQEGLRRLAGRIGVLLQKQTIPKITPKIESEVDADELDELDEDDEQEIPPPAPTGDADADADPADEGEGDEEGVTSQEPKSYDMTEALQTRLRTTLLKARNPSLRKP